MDKFGIFNLLNSFLSFYEKNKSNSTDTETVNVEAKSNIPAPPPTPTPKVALTRPLQSNMLNVMRSHDELIRRVQEKNKAET